MGFNIKYMSQNGHDITFREKTLIVDGKEYELKSAKNNNLVSVLDRETLDINGDIVTVKDDKVFINGKPAKARNDGEESFEPKEVENVKKVNEVEQPSEMPTHKNITEENNGMADEANHFDEKLDDAFITNWIEHEIEKNPAIAEQFKTELLASLQAHIEYKIALERMSGYRGETIKSRCRDLINQYDEMKNKSAKELAKEELLVEIKAYLARYEANDKKYVSFDDFGHRVIQDAINDIAMVKKMRYRNLAEMSVTDAFEKMGEQPNRKQAEKIQQIIHLHDPKVVENAVNAMMENPTPSMLKLMNLDVPKQSRNMLKTMKTKDIVSIIINFALGAMGIVGVAKGEPGMFGIGLMGVAGASFSISNLFRHNNKINNLELKDEYISAIIDDLLQQVDLDEAFNQGLEG